AVVEVVGPDPEGVDELAEERPQGLGVVVDAAQEDGLVEQQEPGLAQQAGGVDGLGGDLADVVEVGDEADHEPALEGADEARADAGRQNDGDPGVKAQQAYVADGLDPAP